MYFAAVFDIGEDREDPILILRIEIGIVIWLENNNIGIAEICIVKSGSVVVIIIVI